MSHSEPHRHFMHRCFDLARLGAGSVSPNPLVGAVVVCNGEIIGEGHHREYGGAHAEREAMNSITPDRKHLIPHSTLYVSLEPCCHHGKTPPCTELIIASGIRQVVISAQDPNPLVSGNGINALKAHGISVLTDVQQSEGEELIRFFRTSMREHRPHVILKIVQTDDGFIGKGHEQVWLSNAYERVMVHKLRSEIDAIMVGTNTAVIDNPGLTTRYYHGEHPLRVIPDRTQRIPITHEIFNGVAPTLYLTHGQRPALAGVAGLESVDVEFGPGFLDRVLLELHNRRIQSLLVEGGAALISGFLHQDLWDEALVVRTPTILEAGIKAPLIEGRLKWRYQMGSDEILAIRPEDSGFK